MEFIGRDVTLGQANAVVKFLGHEGFRALLRGELVVLPNSPEYWQIWCTVKTGGDPRVDIRAAEKFGDSQVGSEVAEVVEKILKTTSWWIKGEAELVLVSTAKLGFTNGASLPRIYGRAEDFGLKLCHPLLGILLYVQLQCRELLRPDGEVMIGMRPINDMIFKLCRAHYGRRLLYGEKAQSEWIWGPETRWVFGR